ncbi:MAG: formylglycine-generating enzyme family protein, partial [Phycisphaerales bacterium]
DVVVQATVIEPDEPESVDLTAPEEAAEPNESSEAPESEGDVNSGDRAEVEKPAASQAAGSGGDAAIAETRVETGAKPSAGPAEMAVDLGGGVKLELVRIAAGQFFMGSPAGEPGREVDEGAMHRVWISKPFYMGKFEVTQAQYEAVTGERPSHFDGNDLPVDSVSWDDAVRFCESLSQKEGRRYRLPTEAEWEYACRGGSSLAFSFGLSYSQLSEHGWHFDISQNKSHVVGQKKSNAFGLHDMHGNVWEWCADWYGKDYYGSSQAVDPEGPASGEHRILRGGSWQCGPALCRSALRGWGPPANRGSHVGFRVVLEAQD